MKDIFAESMETMRQFHKAKEQYGSVELLEPNHKKTFPQAKYIMTEIALTQNAYIDGPTDGTPIYRASGIDINGDEYEIRWDVKDNWKEIEDESEMCDWDNPASITKI